MRPLWIVAIVAFVPACGDMRSPAPDGEQHGYLVFDPPTQEQGWALVDALTARSSEHERIRTSGVVRDGSRTMFVDFSGGCKAQAAFVDEARQIADGFGIRKMSCAAVPPTE